MKRSQPKRPAAKSAKAKAGKTAKPKAPPTKMRDVQRAFAQAIMRPLSKTYGMKPKWTDGRATKKVVAGFIKPNDRLSSFERIEIYNKQYWFRLLDSLWEDFPGLRALMGDDRYHQMSIAYLDAHPSSSFTLRDLGRKLGRFLAREPKWIEPHVRLGRDLVRLEWAHIEAFDGDERTPLSIDELLGTGGDPGALVLHFQPYLSFLECDYPVDDFVISVRRREEPRGEASNAISERRHRAKSKKVKLPGPEKSYIVVHRHEFGVWYKRLTPEAYRLCRALQRGLPLQTACERALGRKKPDDTFSTNLHNWFRQWAQFGWFCRAE